MDTQFTLQFDDRRPIEIKVSDLSSIDQVTMSRLPKPPYWVRLEYHQCSNCPLDVEKVTYCPAAYNLKDIIIKCSDLVSHEQVNFTKKNKSGSVSTRTEVQKALFTIIATSAINSACPILKSRKWVLDHYTLITTPENMFYLSLSSYLVKQFLISTTEKEADFKLKGHLDYVDEMFIVWGSLLERVRVLSEKDGSNNAVVRLIMTASLLKTMREKWIADLKEKVGI